MVLPFKYLGLAKNVCYVYTVKTPVNQNTELEAGAIQRKGQLRLIS